MTEHEKKYKPKTNEQQVETLTQGQKSDNKDKKRVKVEGEERTDTVAECTGSMGTESEQP